MIKLVDVQKSYMDGENKSVILQGINLHIASKEYISIMGPSGCGKSTLLHIMALLTEPTSGHILWEGKRVDFKKEKELETLRKEKIGLIFQNANLISYLNPLENILLAMNTDKPDTANKKTAMELLDRVGIADKYRTHVKSLSGGEAQRVAIVRALVNNPRVLLCDEPTGALDADNGRTVLELLLETRKEAGCAIVMVTHDKDIGAQAERRIILNGGHIHGMDQGLQAI